MVAFSSTFRVRWSDLDANGHMRNSAYLDLASQLRMLYFDTHGFSAAEFALRRIGPVIRRDELVYRRELRLLDEITVSLEVLAMSRDGSRFRLGNDFLLPDGERCCRLTSTGGWLDLERRRLTTPPPELVKLMRRLAPGDTVTEPPLEMGSDATG